MKITPLVRGSELIVRQLAKLPFSRTAVLLAATLALPVTVSAHNLDTRATSISFDEAFVQTMSTRAGMNQPLVQANDEFWVIIKTTPGPGTSTGVGGYQTFYLPSGVKVSNVAYVQPSPSAPNSPSTAPSGFIAVPMNGQSPIAIGSGPIGAATTAGLAGLTLPGVNGLNANNAPVTGTGLHRGTIAGVYADTGIFYSTDPRTAFNSYNAPTNPPMTNNSGDTVGEFDAANIVGTDILGVMTLWDSYQLRAYGRKDVAPIIDPTDGRGNAPWGLGSAVAGPESGYAWEFDFADFSAVAPSSTLLQKVQAGIALGPWNRVKYPGSQISSDQPGLVSSVLGYAGTNASNLGADPSTLVGQNINAVRFAIGQLTLGLPQYSALKIKIVTPPSAGCYTMYADAFGGDAGGLSNGKDHLWRYFDPTVVSLAPCTLLQKTTLDRNIPLNGTTSFKITFANNGTVALPNVVLRDTLPTGLTYLSAIPAPSSFASPNAVWNIGTVLPNQIVTITMIVKGTATGSLLNTVTATSNGTEISKAYDSVEVGAISILREEKTVTPSVSVPNGTVTYTITVFNDGTATNGVPLVVTDFLPTGFTYTSFVSATVNGAAVTPTVAGAGTSTPVFTLNQGIPANKTAVIKFVATVGPNVPTGTYFNSVKLAFEGKEVGPHPEAPVTIGGGQIGDTIFRDWNGDGDQDPGEEGIPGVTVTLSGTSSGTAVTDANGNYLFTGLAAGNYTVTVPTPGTLGVPSGYTLTADPDGGSVTAAFIKTLAANESYLGADWGYRPGGPGAIGDQVFEDLNKNGTWQSGEPNIPNVTVNLYEDTTGNGILDAGDVLVATQVTGGGGTYNFTGLDTTRSYLVDVDQADPDIASYFNTLYGSPANLLTSTDPRPVASGFTTVTTADFGFWQDKPASLGDQVYYDKDNSGTYNAGDIPLANVTVNLFASDGTTFITSTVSAPDGTYRFNGLSPGTYVVKVDTADGDIPSFLAASVSEHTGVVLTAGQTDNTRDFPFISPGLLAKTVDQSQMTTPGTLTFTLTPQYSVNSPLLNATVTDTVPTGTTFISAGQGGVNSPPVTWSLGSTTAKSDGTTTISGSTVTPSTITHVASANASGTGTTVSPARPTGTAANDVLIAGLSWDGGNDRTITAPSGWTQIGTAQSVSASGATIAQRDTATTAIGTTALSITKPSNLQTGDLMIANITARGGATNSASLDGWTVVGSNNYQGGGSNPTQTILYRVVDGTEGAGPYAFSFATEPSETAGQIVAYSGVAVTGGVLANGTGVGPFDVAAGSFNQNSSTSVSAPQITTASANALLIMLLAAQDDTTGITFTGPTILTPGGGATRSSIDDARGTVGMAWNTRATAGATGDGTATLTASKRWSARLLALRPLSATKHGMATYHKVAGGSEPASYDWGISSAAKMTVGISTYRGVDTAAPIDVHAAQTNASSTSAVAPTITTTANNAMLIGVFASKNGTPVATPPGSMTERIDASTTAGGTSEAGLEMSDETFATAGATGTRTATLSAATVNIGRLIALKRGTTSTPWSYSTTAALSANRSLVTGADSMAVTMTLTATTLTGAPPFPISVTPGALSITGTGGGGGVGATFGPASTSPVSLSSGVAQNVTYTSTSLTPGTLAGGVLTFRATPSDGNGTWNQGTANTTLITPPLTLTVNVPNPHPGINQVINTGYLYNNNGGTLLAESPPTLTGLDASIGDYVWADLNGDGLQAGESGIAGVRVYVDSNGNSQYDPGEPFATTDAAGAYRIYGLAAGTYTVRYDYSTVPPGYAPTTSASHTYTLAANEQYSAADFGLRPPGTSNIGDTVWIDANNNGVVDTGETRIANVDVRLYADTDNSGTITAGDLLLQTVSTDANGNYLFTGVAGTVSAPGNYLVDVVEADAQFPAGLALVTGGSPITSPPPGGLHDVSISAAATTYDTADFGYNFAGQIGDTVFYDPDASGTQTGGELGVAGVTIVLHNDLDSSGTVSVGDTVVKTVFTDSNGNYLFDNLPPGKYVVKVDEQTVQSTPTSGVYGTMLGTTGSSKAVELIHPGSLVNLTADFGFIEAAEIEGIVFHDVNNSGSYDSGETPLQPVTVTVYGPGLDGIIGTADDLADPRKTIDTNTQGEYSFLLPPGSYRVIYDAADPQAQAGVLTQVTTVLEYIVTLTAGQEVSGLDFGRDNPGSIGDTIFADADGNGSQGAGEVGIPGVTVQLYLDVNTDNLVDGGDTLLDTRVTDAAGNYLFGGLADGNYAVAVVTATLPSGYNTTPTAGPTNSEWVAFNSSAGATVSGGGATLTVDFGYQLLATTFTVSGNIWNDANGDGIKLSEANIANVDVIISVDADNAGPNPLVLYTVTTDASGNYILAGVPGAATVIITVVTGTLPNTAYVNTFDPDNGATDPDDSTTTFTMPAANVINQDFGYQLQPGSIAGTVVVGSAANGGNGLADVGEAGLAGVTVTLRYAGVDGILGTGDDVIASVLTDANGAYVFNATTITSGALNDGLLPGLYQITETNPVGYISWADADFGNPDNIITTLALGESQNNKDFEDTLPGTISGTVQVDTNGNFIYDGTPTDEVLAGVTLRLLDASGNLVLDSNGLPIVTLSDVNGNYSFTNLLPGNYRVAETQPIGFSSISDKDTTIAQFYAGTGDPNLIGVGTPITIAAGGTSSGNNFLEIKQACPNTWAGWLAKWSSAPFSIPIGDLDPADNPDGDRYENLAEYAFCLPPNSGVLKPFCLAAGSSGGGTVDGIYRRTAGGATDVTYYLQYKSSLSGTWTSLEIKVAPAAGANATASLQPDGTEVVTIPDLELLTGLTAGEGFVRMRVDLANPAATAYSEVLGWTETTLSTTCNTFNNPYLRCSSFTGKVASVSGQVVTFVGTGDLTFLNSGGPYYLEVTTPGGANEGKRFDLASPTPGTSDTKVTLSNDSDKYDGLAPFNTNDGVLSTNVAADDTVIIRQHWTLGIQFPVGGFTADTTAPLNEPAAADQVQIYVNGAWTSYFLYDADGAGGAAPKWVLLTDSGHADQGATVLPAGQGMFVSKPQSNVTVLMYGEVRQNAFIRPLQAGDTLEKHNNLVGGGFPIDQSANAASPAPYGFDREMSLTAPINSFFGDRDFKLADSFFVWRGDPPTSSGDSYDTYYLFSSVAPRPVALRWVKVGDVNLAARDAELLFLSDRSVFIRVKNALPAYKMPCPWTP